MIRLLFLIITTLTIFKNIDAVAKPIDFFKLPGITYDSAITTPDAFIGHGLGDRPVRHDVMVGYLRSLARQSARIKTETIGFSHEGRPIMSFVISAPENIARIEEIKQAHKEHLSGAASHPDNPVVVWLNYGVHGAESSGMDAVIPTLYHLAAAQGEAVDQMLQNSVIVIIAIFNPDGHSRRINHIYTFGGATAVTDPRHEAHNLWIEARTNHYWFDLNRDWLLLTQPESRAWIKVWHDWKPNVSADFHEMGSNSSYYFHPGEPRRKNPMIPDRARELLSSIAEDHAAWLDSQGELYTSEEGFDNFYIGKGSTYPGINGSVGILFENAAARGGRIETDNGIRTYAQNINIHFNTSLTTITGAIRNRENLLNYQREFFVLSERAARADEIKAYVITAGEDITRLGAFADMLNGHDIEVYALGRDLTLNEQTFSADKSLIIPMGQAQYMMIKGIFDRVSEFEESVFYDVSGWTLPLAYDLDSAVLNSFRFNQGLIGARVTPSSPGPAIPAPEQASYGYIFSWAHYHAPRALYRFLEAGARPRVLMRPKQLSITDNIVSLERGAIFIPVTTADADPALLHQTAITIAREDKITVHALTSGNAIAGVGDLGSTGSVRTLTKPKILLLFDDGSSRYGAGQLWHLLDRKMQIPVSLRRKSEIDALDLADYTHILLPGGGETLSKEKGETLSAWVKEGGVLIATKAAAHWVQKTMIAGKDKQDKQQQTPAEEEEERPRLDYADKGLEDAKDLIGGAIFESDLDITHPLGFGFTDRSIATMRASIAVLPTPEDPYATVARYSQAPLLSGYASDKRRDEIAGTPMLTANRHGQGSLILFADDPAFRATFLGPDKLVLNAVFFGTLFNRARAD